MGGVFAAQGGRRHGFVLSSAVCSVRASLWLVVPVEPFLQYWFEELSPSFVSGVRTRFGGRNQLFEFGFELPRLGGREADAPPRGVHVPVLVKVC